MTALTGKRRCLWYALPLVLIVLVAFSSPSAYAGMSLDGSLDVGFGVAVNGGIVGNYLMEFSLTSSSSGFIGATAVQVSPSFTVVSAGTLTGQAGKGGILSATNDGSNWYVGTSGGWVTKVHYDTALNQVFERTSVQACPGQVFDLLGTASIIYAVCLLNNQDAIQIYKLQTSNLNVVANSSPVLKRFVAAGVAAYDAANSRIYLAGFNPVTYDGPLIMAFSSSDLTYLWSGSAGLFCAGNSSGFLSAMGLDPGTGYLYLGDTCYDTGQANIFAHVVWMTTNGSAFTYVGGVGLGPGGLHTPAAVTGLAVCSSTSIVANVATGGGSSLEYGYQVDPTGPISESMTFTYPDFHGRVDCDGSHAYFSPRSYASTSNAHLDRVDLTPVTTGGSSTPTTGLPLEDQPPDITVGTVTCTTGAVAYQNFNNVVTVTELIPSTATSTTTTLTTGTGILGNYNIGGSALPASAVSLFALLMIFAIVGFFGFMFYNAGKTGKAAVIGSCVGLGFVTAFGMLHPLFMVAALLMLLVMAFFNKSGGTV